MAGPTDFDDDQPKRSQLPSNDDLSDLDKQTSELSARLDKMIADAEDRTNKKPGEAKEKSTDEAQAAADLVRSKVEALYKKEPNAREEVAEAKAAGSHRSKHQKFIYELTTSGKSLAEIQTAWHEYYVDLSDTEKHDVWKEFYAMHGASSQFAKSNQKAQLLDNSKPDQTIKTSRRDQSKASVAELKDQLANKASGKRKLKAKHHFKALAFGLGMGAVVLFAILFGFFNERFIAPFISPSRNISATPIITDGSGVVGPEPKILIPKINLEVPVVYDLGTNEEKAVQHALESGVVHYDGTPNPGQQGNVVIVGHSSNNILNGGRYKFAFVLLKRMEVGDTIFLQKGGQRYTYQVIENKVVEPNDVSVLGTASKPNTVTLITCDPPGTSINRRIIVAEQISPDPAKNEAVELETIEQPSVLPSNAQSLWQRIIDWF